MKTRFLIAAVLAGLCAAPAMASPWAEVGDNQLRSEIEYLSASGAVDEITTQWPLPWNNAVETLSHADLSLQPQAVQTAARRVLTLGRLENSPGMTARIFLDATNMPATVYGFDGMGLGEGAGQLSLSFSSENYAARVSVGMFSPLLNKNGNKLMMDGTYVAAKIGSGVMVYGGYLDHWWGPGWISALSLSNNARPMPQIGIQRLSTEASSWPVLRWLGPWQAEFLVGMLDDPRPAINAFYNALRLTFHPIPSLEIGLSRTEQFCGKDHPCSPLRDYFSLRNDPSVINKTNDQGGVDIKFSHTIAGVPTQVYMQLMNEDSSPFTHSGTSHLFGVTAFLPAPVSPVRVTVEYADSVPTLNIFSFGTVMHGFSYNNYSYTDGMRYRGRSLGFSLDSDSRLLSLQGSWSDSGGRFYQLSLHHAVISNPNIKIDNPLFFNAVTTAPVIANIAEARVALPLPGAMKLDLAARLMDDQPRPDKGFAASIEAALRIAL